MKYVEIQQHLEVGQSISTNLTNLTSTNSTTVAAFPPQGLGICGGAQCISTTGNEI